MTDHAITQPAAPSGLPQSGLLRSILVSAALPFVAVTALEHYGVGDVRAVAVAALIPAASALWSFLAKRRVDMIGLAVLVTMIGAVAVSLASNDPRFGLMKAAPAYGLFGLACVASLPSRRPLMFFVGRHFAAGADATKLAAWDARLASPGFRRAMRVLTTVWGVAALAECALGMAAALYLPTRLALVAEPSVAIGTVAGLLAWTAGFSRRRESAAAAATAATATATAVEPESRTAPAADPAAFHQTWYPVALASEIADGGLVGQDFCGSRVVVYRDAEGKAVVQSAWCPHLGADLSVGQVVDGRLRCAFHHWSFDTKGQCAHIPTGDKILPEARIATYPSAERWGIVWAFNGSEPLFPPPTIPDAEPADLEIRAFRLGERPVEVFVATSNGVDFQHLRALHGLKAETPPLLEVGRYGLEYSIETEHALQHGRITGTNCFSQHLRIGKDHMFMLFSSSALARNRSLSYYAVGVRPGEATEARLKGLKDFVDKLLSEDLPVLSTIRFRKGVLTAADRHLARFLHYVETFPTARPAD